ncbi:hypothetical protein DL93DRAFT_2058713 [Clavulina sp. PMI_390]|nr:hypothetical protein DL93DRAFT_2058713 [Clavulina sp. PMI_390]
MYLGDFIVEAWATTSDSKNTTYIQPGDLVRVSRSEPESMARSESTNTKKPKNGQTTLSFASKSKPAPKSRKPVKENNIVRFSNQRGSEVGRLPNHVASWVSKLFDLGIIHMTGTVIDCPKPLRTGNNVVLSLRAYFVPQAFQKRPSFDGDNDQKTFWEEGKETLDEQILRERKESLQQLFEAVSLRPVRQSGASKSAHTNTDDKVSVPSSKGKGKASAMEVIGDDEDAEEVEVEGEELDDQQVSLIYRKAQQNDREMPEREPPGTFLLNLRPYQKQALSWMAELESRDSVRDTTSMDPLWEEYIFPPEPDEAGALDLTEDDVSFYLNPYSGDLSLTFPKVNRSFRGGILADANLVGLGKTIMVASLLHTNNSPEPAVHKPAGTSRPQISLDRSFKPKKHSASDSELDHGPSATLIIAPVSLLAQWRSELARCSASGSLHPVVWHGSSRGAVNVDSGVDVIITSYGTLATEHAKVNHGGKSALYDVEWKRVILDEAHYIKSRTSKTAKAVYDLNARCRWALTGTPITNRLEDLFSLLHFLQFDPWASFPFFNSFITKPFLNKDPKAIEIVQVILESVLLRREKSMKDKDGNPIVQLPPKTINIEHLDLTPDEHRLYDAIFKNVKKDYESLTARGLITKNITSMLARIMTLRRAACHPALVRDSQLARQATAESEQSEDDAPQQNNAYHEAVLANLKSEDSGDDSCVICFEPVENQVLVKGCSHSGCKDCIVAYIRALHDKGKPGSCPICFGPAKESELLEVVRHTDRATSADPGSSATITLQAATLDDSSTKLNALLKALRVLREQDPCYRTVVFSQWTTFLDLIALALDREKIAWSRLDGSMTQIARTKAIDEFMKPTRSPRVFIVSLKSGGVGLNLTNANTVFMMDCWWSLASEDQAVDRVHRIGQDRPVTVTKFIARHTIEERILVIQNRKNAIVNAALRGGKAGGSDSKEVLENLRIMFGEDE